VKTGNERRARGSRRVNEDWRHLTRAEWDALPVGSLREVEVARGVRLVMERTEAGRYRVQTRGGIPTSWLARFPSVERVRRGGEA
jgi:hypothetical protein